MTSFTTTGHTLFVMDIPRLAGPGGHVVGGKARRLTINKNKSKGGQICIEEYTQGSQAKVGIPLP
jgi:hypothetical protein